MFRSSVSLFALTLLAGLGDYLFLLIAARNLAVDDYGRLLEMLSYYGLLASLAFGIQSHAVAGGTRIVAARGAFAALSVLLLAGLLAMQNGGRGSHALLFLWGVPAAALLRSAWGHLQRQKRFLYFGIALLLPAFAKVLFGSFADSVSGFELSVVAAFVVSAALTWYLLSLNAPAPQHPTGRVDRTVAFLSLLVGVGFTLYPTLDLLTARYLLGPALAGLLGKLQIFAKILFFGPMALLTVTLPHYVEAVGGKSDFAAAKRLRRLELGALAACAVGAFLAGFLVPPIGAALGLGELDGRMAFLACWAMVPLYGLMSCLQLALVLRDVKLAVLCVVLPLLSPVLAFAFGIHQLEVFLLFIALFNSLAGMTGLLWAKLRMSRAGKRALVQA